MKTMEPSVSIERECTLLGTLFQYIITDLKVSYYMYTDRNYFAVFNSCC